MNGRVVIVDDEPITRMDIRDMLETADYEVVGEAADGVSAIDICKKTLPDLTLMDIKMPILDGLRASRNILENHYSTAVVIMSAYSDKEYIEKAKDYGVGGFIVKPVDEKSFIPTIEVAFAGGKKNNKLERLVDEYSQKLKERKVIEKAKGILMIEQEIDEDAAYQLLRKLSMDRRCRIVEIAEMLIIED